MTRRQLLNALWHCGPLHVQPLGPLQVQPLGPDCERKKCVTPVSPQPTRYDFIVFAQLSKLLTHLFFPSSDAATAALAFWGVFAVGCAGTKVTAYTVRTSYKKKPAAPPACWRGMQPLHLPCPTHTSRP